MDEFLATVTGAVIAGLIGIATLLCQQWFEARRRLNENVLGPAFNYVRALETSWPWEGTADPPWTQMDPYHWFRVPGRFRRPLGELANKVGVSSKAYGEYFQFMGEKGWPGFGKAVDEALQKYVAAGTSAIPATSIGIDSMAVIQTAWITAGIVPYVLNNPGDAELAWEQLIRDNPNLMYWAVQVVRALRTRDPDALGAITQAILGRPEADKARPLVEAAYRAHQSLVAQAQALKPILARRLGIDEGTKPGSG